MWTVIQQAVRLRLVRDQLGACYLLPAECSDVRRCHSEWGTEGVYTAIEKRLTLPCHAECGGTKRVKSWVGGFRVLLSLLVVCVYESVLKST